VVNSDLGSTGPVEMVRSQVSARAIAAVCLLMDNSLDLETLMMVNPRYHLVGNARPLPSRATRE
jgi:hypothetical protein